MLLNRIIVITCKKGHCWDWLLYEQQTYTKICVLALTLALYVFFAWLPYLADDIRPYRKWIFLVKWYS